MFEHIQCGPDPETITTEGTILPLVDELKQIGGDGWSEPRHGCGPGEALPADTKTEGARLPRKTREELIEEYYRVSTYALSIEWPDIRQKHQRLADLAGQIARMSE